MKHLVIGCGEVGKALMEVLNCEGHDPQKGYDRMDAGPVDMLHICIPYSETRPENWSDNVVWLPFKDWVREYQAWFKPTFTVIHSTVPIGTSDELNAHHSPIRGRHPHLAASIRTFTKYVGGPDSVIIADEFSRRGIQSAMSLMSAKDAEAGKLIDLMQFGQSVMLEKSIHEFCERNGLSFDIVYTRFNQSYNRGYLELGEYQFQRPVLAHIDGPIGGHCVAQNMKWLDMHEADEILFLNSVLSKVKEPA
jgi:hypothetical protein